MIVCARGKRDQREREQKERKSDSRKLVSEREMESNSTSLWTNIHNVLIFPIFETSLRGPVP